MRGRKLLAGFFAFFESILWLVAAAQVLQNLDSPFKIIAYAAGYAVGTAVGTYIEQWLAIGNTQLRIIAPTDSPSIADALRNQGYLATTINAEGRDGNVRVTFSVVPRRKLKKLLSLIASVNKNAFVTLDDTQLANIMALPASRVRK